MALSETAAGVLGPVGQEPRPVSVIPCFAYIAGLGLSGRPANVVGTAYAGLPTVRPILVKTPPSAVENFKVLRGHWATSTTR